MISPPMISSGMNTSPHSNFSPSTVMAFLLSSSTAPGSTPESSISWTRPSALSSLMPTMASVN
jgi:hypothetical protein